MAKNDEWLHQFIDDLKSEIPEERMEKGLAKIKNDDFRVVVKQLLEQAERVSEIERVAERVENIYRHELAIFDEIRNVVTQFPGAW